MKIVQLTYSLSSGGAERLVVDLSNQLAKESTNEIVVVSILSDKDNANTHYLQELDRRVRYINLDCAEGLKPYAMWRVYNAIKNEKPDVVHVHCNLVAIMLTAFLYRKPRYVHTLHSLADICLAYNSLKWLYTWFYKKQIQPITISEICQESYKKLYGNERAVCIVNGRSWIGLTDMCNAVKMEVDAFRTTSQTPVFINVARCNPLKNHRMLFETFRQMPDAQLVVVGRGFEDSELFRYSELPNIHFVGEKRNVGDYLAACDFFILSSDYEGLPLTLLEAMSMGLIPVSTPAGGVQDVIEDGRNGYMTKGFSPEEFLAKVRQAIAERGRFSSESIMKEYEDNYSMRGCAEKYCAIYSQLR